MKTTESFLFPFFGAGLAHYYEWAAVTVRFVNEPTKEQQQKITELAPGPIKPDGNSYCGKMMVAGSDQFVNMWIEEAYGHGNSEDKDEEETFDDEEEEDEYEDDDDSEFYVSEEAHQAFEKDLERWLLEVHGFCPIEFVFREEDGEAGGTELSAWHDHSLGFGKQLLQKWTTEKAIYDQSEAEKALFCDAAQSILDIAEISLNEADEKLADLIAPERNFNKMLSQGNIDEIKAYLASIKNESRYLQQAIGSALNYFCDQLFDEADYEKIGQFGSIIPISKLTGRHIGAYVYALHLANEEELIRSTLKEIGHPCAMANNIGSFIFEELLPAQQWQHSIDLFTYALELETGDCNKLEVYCNALYVLQHDNTGLPVNAALNHKFLAKSLKYAPKNPAIYFNAACLYVEMKDFENTLQCIRLAKEHRFDGYAAMIKEISSAAMFADFMEYPALKEYLGK
ncbi:MAG: hypothetical protein J7578_10365 [Chitinophagaceae bacterium]|nr:hypothetical protein [Chitinophagaceae bacterium]